MLKFIFACLLLVNGALLAFQLGWFDALVTNGHEPQRLKNQVNPDKIRITQPTAALAVPAQGNPAAPATASTSTPATPAPAASVSAAPATPAAMAPPASRPAPAPAASSGASPPAASPTPAATSRTNPPAASPPAAPAAKPPVPAASGTTPAPASNAPAAPASNAPPAPATAPVVPVVAKPALETRSAACTEIGNLTLVEGKRFETRLATLKLADKPARREVRDQSSHMVWIPPQPSGKEGADKKSAELRKLGINDFFVLQENPEQRFGISLGVFKSEEAARARLAKLTQAGVRSARLVEHKMPLVRVAFQLRTDAQAKKGLDQIRAEFPRSEEKACAA
ncbi:MAG: hypothetical protein JWP36_1534 [Paucimonas sp.]|nr:hypothetical protein [Paucimonas sp.]